jgi:hypothetical protein
VSFFINFTADVIPMIRQWSDHYSVDIVWTIDSGIGLDWIKAVYCLQCTGKDYACAFGAFLLLS